MSAQESVGDDCRLNIRGVNGIEVISLENAHFENEERVALTTGYLTDLLGSGTNVGRRFIVNLEAVDYMSSTGLGMLLTFNSRVQKRKHRAVVCSLQTQIEELLTVTNLTKVIDVAQDEQAAIVALST